MPASVDLVDVRLDLRRGARRFDGIGGLSAGASSRALFDYPGISLSIFIFAIIVFVSFIKSIVYGSLSNSSNFLSTRDPQNLLEVTFWTSCLRLPLGLGTRY